MNESEKEFLRRLLATFKIEADEYIKSISSGLVELEKTTSEEEKKPILDHIYRQAHSFKGAARAVDLSSIESICQLLESIFKDFKYKGVPQSTPMYDLLQDSLHTIETILTRGENIDVTPVLQSLEWIEAGRLNNTPGPGATPLFQPPDPTPSPSPQPLPTPSLPTPPGQDKRRFNRQGVITPTNSSSNPPTPPVPPPQTESPVQSTIRVASDKLDRLLLQAEEMISMKLSINRRLSELKELLPLLAENKKKRSSAQASIKTLRKTQGPANGELEKMFTFLQYNHDLHKQLESRISRLIKVLQIDQRVFGTMIDSHLDDLRKALMLPLVTLLENFPRMVRDLARQKGKEIDLVIKGKEIEIDRRILEELKDPLIHLLRNAVDHGIESPQQRLTQHKPQRARIELIVTQKENNNVEIAVSDDGAGLNTEQIKRKILELGLYSADELERLTENEIFSSIFCAEFSTSPIITDLSGRGLGLAIVREKVEKLGGRLSVESRAGQGATFRMILQTTLATFRGILVTCAGRHWVIPTIHLEQALKISCPDIKTVENRETICWRNNVISFVHMDEVLGLTHTHSLTPASSKVDVIILAVGDRRMAFQVDGVMDEREVLVKELGKQLVRVKNIAGATILGSGEVVPILNVVDLMKSAVWVSSVAPTRSSLSEPDTTKKPPGPGKKSVLVAEDSITSRMLLKNILESAGYRVRVAVDGMDGWVALKEDTIDLAVLDIEMPRMNGFELTQKIREDRNLNRLPVVLVTALESREDREKGIDVGADAYIIKSSFDQSNLLDVVKRLI